VINKSILVLEENSVVHGLVASALDVDGLTLHHEFNPAKYVDRARNLKPDLILVSNADQFNNYSICRQLKTGPGGGPPLVLLANSRDALDAARLRDLRVDGVVRKPFEASDLQEQVSKHLRLPDLVGAAYEYRQSQSAREAMFDPLAQLEVLDEETVTMMKTTGAGIATPVPEVDFSAELSDEAASAESAATEDLMAARMTEAAAVYREERGILTETRTERTVERMLEGAQSPLPLADFDDSDLAQFPPAEGETLLEASTFEQEDLSQPFPGMRAGEEDHFEELGVEDLLDEESLEESGQLALAAEIGKPPEQAPPLELRPSALDQIDVELSAADLTVQAAARLEPEPDDMTLFEHEFEPPAPATPRPVDETIPLAVRRMLEMQPVFKPPAPGAAGATARTETAETQRTPSETAGTQRTPSETVETVSTLAEMPWPELAPEEPAAAEELDDLANLGLGDDALDEEQILSAMESEPMADIEDLEGLDDDSLMSLSLEDEDPLAFLPEPAPADVELSAPEEDDEEISIDEDEEELILSSLEEEELEERALEAPMRTALDLSSTERSGLDEIMAAQEEPAAKPLSAADEQEIAAMDLDLPTQEATPRDSDLPFPTDELLEFPIRADLSLGSRTTETTRAAATQTVTTAETRQTALEEFPEPPEMAIEFGADDLEADLFSDTDLGSLGDALAEPEPGARAEPEPEPEPASAGGGGEAAEFESAFAALRDEIQAHPEGEHLDDVLRLERIQNKIARLEFTIPQHESPFARGIGMYAMADGAPVISPEGPARASLGAPGTASQESTRQSSVTTERTLRMTTVETRLTEALEGGPGAGSLLDEATKARLSEVLDEIISISVRNAVREEMPRLMQRLAKDSPQA
jgi:CheY-like chemotaxis protein